MLIIIKTTQAVIKDHTFRSSNHKIQNGVTGTVIYTLLTFLRSNNPKAGFDPPCPRLNDLLNEKVDDLDHQATTAGPGSGLMNYLNFFSKFLMLHASI